MSRCFTQLDTKALMVGADLERVSSLLTCG